MKRRTLWSVILKRGTGSNAMGVKQTKEAESLEQTGCKSEGCEMPLRNLVLLVKGVGRVGVERAPAHFLPHSLRVIGFEEVKIFELTEVIIEIYQSHREELSALTERVGRNDRKT